VKRVIHGVRSKGTTLWSLACKGWSPRATYVVLASLLRCIADDLGGLLSDDFLAPLSFVIALPVHIDPRNDEGAFFSSVASAAVGEGASFSKENKRKLKMQVCDIRHLTDEKKQRLVVVKSNRLCENQSKGM